MSSRHRFNFPGFVLVRRDETPTHEVEVGKIRVGATDLYFTMLRNHGLPEGVGFAVAEIASRSAIVWRFKQEGYVGVGTLALAGDEVIIALYQSGPKGKVQRIIPVSKFVGGVTYDVLHMLQLKKSAAEFLGREYELTPSEAKVSKVLLDRQRAKEEEDRRIEAEKRAAAREELVKRVLGRGKIECYLGNGRKAMGIPVLGNEWPSLPNGTIVVLASSFDGEGHPINPTELFTVQKEPGKNPIKSRIAQISTAPQEVQRVARVKPVDTALVERDGQFYELFVYQSLEQIAQARAQGLNGGSLVCVGPVQPGGSVIAYRACADKMETLGLVLVL